MAIVFPTAQVGQRVHAQQNHYDPEKFCLRDGKGRLRNRYQQRTMLVTEDFIVGYQQALEEEVGDAAAEIMYRCGYEWGKVDVSGFEKRFQEEFGKSIQESHSRMVLETWWWPLQAAGWGSWNYDLSQIKEGLIFIDLFESAVCLQRSLVTSPGQS